MQVTTSATLAGLALGALTSLGAEISDDFESYALGSNLHGQGNWAGWDNDPGAGALVSSLRAASGTQSVRIAPGSDLVHTFSGVGGGIWNFSLKQYVPSTASGESYVILLNKYQPGGPYDWSVQMLADLTEGKVTSEMGYPGNELPLVKDTWVDLRFEIDFTTGTVSEYYNNQLLSTHPWDDGNGVQSLAALDLYADSSQSGFVFYDDLHVSQVPEPSTFALLGLGGLALLARRRSRRA